MSRERISKSQELVDAREDEVVVEKLTALEKAYKINPIPFLKQILRDLSDAKDTRNITSFGIVFPEPDIQ